MAVEIKSELLQPLAALEHVKSGAAAYFLRLRKNPDPFVAVGAWCALLDGGQLGQLEDLWDELLSFARHDAVRQRAFAFFHDQVFEYALAKRAAHTPVESLNAATADGIRSMLSFKAALGAEASGRAYLATGDLQWFDEAQHRAETAGGWREAIPSIVRMILIAPTNATMHQRMLEALRNAGGGELLDEYAQLLSNSGLYPQIASLFAAAAALRNGNPGLCVARLRPLEVGPQADNPAFATYRVPALQFKAEAEEKLGQFTAAYRDFVAMNESDPAPNVDPEDFYRRTAAKAQLRIPILPADPRTDVVQMVGFPRSGTTLLENALAAHTQIETFEEILAMVACGDVVALALEGRAPMPKDPAQIFLQAREKYYEEIDRRREKPAARALIDKMPLRSSEADFVTRLFPESRYIFSIRHPYDVVLSCFKQRFSPNPAMENFRTIEKTVRAYDFTMTEWFARHTLDDPRVHYVRYDALVTEFESVMTGVLRFLGLDWEDAIRDFAKAANARAARTPSYGKVRQGLSIGVQTYWRDYSFVFDSAAAQPLKKWADLFGYETSVA